MNRRLLGSILLITFLILSITGALMYFISFEKNIASIHTLFAFLFILSMVFHILNNKKPLLNYVTGKKLAKSKKLQSPLIFLILSLIAMGLYHDIPILNEVYNWGNQIRNRQIGKIEETFEYQIINLEKTIGNQKITIEFKKGEAFQYPLFAIWTEDLLGNYIETLYISRVISSSVFDYGKNIEGNWVSSVLRRPEALPYWSHKRGIQAPDGLYTPLDKAPDLDAVSGATPTGNFVVKSKGNFNKKSGLKLLIEINQSYDWNDYYTRDKFPRDKIYSGSGQVGQPSLIYASPIKIGGLESTNHEIMKLIGHGHHSGENGELYTDLSKITTAKNIANRIIVTLE